MRWEPSRTGRRPGPEAPHRLLLNTRAPGEPGDADYQSESFTHEDSSGPPAPAEDPPVPDMQKLVPITAPVEDQGRTIVNTAEELQRAIAKGARDIEIQSHLNLTSLSRTPSRVPWAPRHPKYGEHTHLMYVTAETRSIRVRPSHTCQSSCPAKV